MDIVKLNDKCKQRLIMETSAILQNAKIKNNVYLDEGTLRQLRKLDGILPENKRQNLEQYLGENPVSTFIFSEISQDLYFNREFDLDGNDYISLDLPNLNKKTEELIKNLSSLPWTYYSSIKINRLCP